MYHLIPNLLLTFPQEKKQSFLSLLIFPWSTKESLSLPPLSRVLRHPSFHVTILSSRNQHKEAKGLSCILFDRMQLQQACLELSAILFLAIVSFRCHKRQSQQLVYTHTRIITVFIQCAPTSFAFIINYLQYTIPLCSRITNSNAVPFTL